MEVREHPDPMCGPDQVVVAVKACGVDRGGDLYVWRSVPGMAYATPVVVGAENCGEIVEVGDGVQGWSVGDRVVSEVIVGSCARCALCLSGRELHCRGKQDLGRMVDGAFADYFATPARRLHRIPDSVSWRGAVLTEMAAVVGRNLLEEVRIAPGQRVAVVGPGPVGLMATQLAAASGASQVAIVGLASDSDRIALAASLGATASLVSDSADFAEQTAATHPDGFDVVAECTGSASGIGTALALAAPHSTVAAIGTPLGKTTPVEWAQVAMKDLTIRGTYAHRWSTFESVLDLMGRGVLQTESLYTRSYDLADWETAFIAVDESRDLIKVGLCPGDLV
jgi:threonine dehydrogenase-like Zn-dependent dehydrogenase